MSTEPHFPGTGPHPHPHPYYYQHHWRGYRPRGPTRLVWFVIGAGAATLYYRGKRCHREELGAGYPSNSANGGSVTTTPYEERQVQLREREWQHWHWPTWREREREREAWRAREEARAATASTVAPSAPAPVVAAVPSSPAQAPPTPAAPPMNSDEKSSAGAFWDWTQAQDPVRGATDAVSILFYSLPLSTSSQAPY